MRKKCNRIISSLIAFVFVLNLNVSVFAATDSVNSSDPKSNSIEFRNDEGMEIKIDIIENENGIIVKEYDDGTLVSTVEGEKGDTVFTKTEGDKVETVDYSDYVDVDNGTERSGSTRKTKNLGTMSYRVDGNKIDVTCKTEEKVSTYNIKNFTGKVIDLVVILAGSLSLPSILSKQFVQALIWNGFLYVSSNEVKKVVGIETLASTVIDNSFEICDSKNTRNKERFNGGTEYIIIETGRVNEKYKEGGFVESDFNTKSFKAFCHKQIFGTISNDENIY